MFADKYDHSTRSLDRLPPTQRRWEFESLLDVYRKLAPFAALEIGTAYGGSLKYFLQLARPETRVISIDNKYVPPEVHDWIPEGVQYWHIEGDSHDAKTLERVCDLIGNNPGGKWESGKYKPLEFIFIDADHTYEGAKRDFEMYGPLVGKGGVIAFHDIIDPAPHRNQDHIRVSVLWDEIRRAGYVTQEFICHPDQDWGGIGVIYV